MRVPLLLRAPGLGIGAIPRLARTRDLAATVCALVGAPWIEGVGGRSMLPALRGERADTPDPVLSRTTGTRPYWSLRTGEWTLLRHSATGRTQLYDARADPGERSDLGARRPDLAAELLRSLAERLAADRTAGAELRPPPATNAHRADLEALGYAGGDG